MAEHQGTFKSMKEWMAKSFGPTLCELFFYPFHELYTAGLYDHIAPQDAYKSPVDLRLAIRGALDEAPAVGYNVTFVYPADDLNTLARRMASQCKMSYDKQVERIDFQGKEIMFADGTTKSYDQLISTLPLNKIMEITGLTVEQESDPCTSVIVLNIGAVREGRCPDQHWLYNTNTNSGFHRVGFYSNVDHSFLPKSAQTDGDRVSIYVERAYADGEKPTEEEIRQYGDMVVKELQQWGYIGDAEVVDPTWIEVAYTWNWPNSGWINEASKKLEEHGIYQVGRYARWSFQGIADSIREGFHAGISFRRSR
jgi:protoporphyrinogen oxidase